MNFDNKKMISQGFVYFRDMPSALNNCIYQDGFIQTNKDGAKFFSGHQIPRMSLFVYATGNINQDKERVRKLEATLFELKKNNQIVDFEVLPYIQ